MIVGSRLKRVYRWIRARDGLVLRALILSLGVAVGSVAALANPKGGSVVSGGISISMPNSSTLDVNQSSNNGIIDWQSFNIATGEKTIFQVPSTSATTLNRVNVGNPSTIAGTLKSNGNLILVNPSGIVFANGAQVNANSLLATTTDITNKNFLNGNMKFDIPSKDPNASIVNAGHITVAQSGLAALVAPNVVNSGVIAAKLGKVTIAGAETYTLDFYGDGLINFDVGPGVTQVPTAGNGQQVASLVTNTGKILAPGGTVLLTADAASGLLTNVIEAGGTIAAPTVAQKTGNVTIGNITINGGSNGALVTGAVNVSGQKPGQTGGKAIVTGSNVTLASTANINASGYAGGGTVEVGGGPHGADPTVANAQNTTVAAGATINASATNNGNGGTVSVWSDGSTVFAGTILAEGGPNGGNGGWVETSGHDLGIPSGAVVNASALASTGTPGTWLLDPYDITISSNPDTGYETVNSGTAIQPNGTADPVNVNNGTLDSALNGTSILIFTTNTTTNGGTDQGNITVQDPITWGGATTGATSLELHADNNIVINAAITGSNSQSGLILLAGTNGPSSTGSVFINAPIKVGSFGASTSSGGTINLNYSGGTAVTTNDNCCTSNQDYLAPVVLQAATTLQDTASSGIDFHKTVDGGYALTVDTTGTTTFGGAVGKNTPLTSVTTEAGGYSTVLTGNVSTTGAQTYGAAVTLTTDTTLASSGNSGISLNSTVAGSGHALTVNTTGTTTFGGAVSGLTTLTTEANGTAVLTGNVTTSGAQTYNGAVSLAANTILQSTNNAAIALDSTVDGGHSLTVDTTGATTFGGIVGGTTPLTSLTTNTGGSTTLDANVTTAGAQTYNDAVILGGTLTLNSNSASANGAIDFVSTVNGAYGLTVDAGTGKVTFGGVVGATAALTGLEVTGPTTLDANITTAGAQTYNSAVTLGATVTLNSDSGSANGAVDFASTVDGNHGLTITAGTGTTTFDDAVGGGTPLTSLTSNTAGTTALDGGAVTTTGAQTYNDAVTLGAATTLAANGVTFSNTLDGAYSLSIGAGSGTVTFGGAVGNTNALTSLTETAAGATMINGGSIATSGAQSYLGATTLGETTSLSTTNTLITLGGQVSGTGVGLSLNSGSGGATLNGVNLGTGNLTLPSGGTLTLNAGTYDIATSAGYTFGRAVTLDAAAAGTLTLGQNTTFGGAVTLAHDTTLSSRAASGNIIFTSAGTIDATATNGQALTIDAGSGKVTFGAVVGGSKALKSLKVTDPEIDGDQTAGSFDYTSPVTIGGNVTLTATGQIQFESTVDDAKTAGTDALTLSTTGATIFGGQVGSIAALASLTVNGAGGTTQIDGGTGGGGVTVATTGAQTYNATTLGAAAVLTSSSGGDISFSGTVAGGGFGLNVNTAGATIFNGGVSGLTTLATDSAGTTQINGGSVSTSGTQTYNDPVTLGATTTLTSTGTGANGNIDLANTVGGAFALTVDTAGTTTFGGAVSGLVSVTTDAPGTTAINGGSVSTSGAQTYNDAVTLGAATTITATNSDVAFEKTVQNAETLTVTNGTGNVTFGDQVGTTATPLTGLTITKGTNVTLHGVDAGALSLAQTGTLFLDAGDYTINPPTPYTFGATTTSGTLTLGQPTTFGAITLGADTTLNSSTANGALDFAGSIDGGFSLETLSGAAQTTFAAAVGGGTPLTSFIANAGSISLSASSPISTGGGDLELISTGTGTALTLPASLSGETISLSSLGAIDQTGGTINAAAVTTSSVGGTSLNEANQITSTFNATNTTSGNVALTNTATTLTVTGVSQTGGGGVTIGNTGNLTTSGAVTTAANGDISLTATSGALTIGAVVTAGGTGTVDLSNTGASKDIALNGTVSGGSLTVESGGGNISQTAAVSATGTSSFTTDATGKTITLTDANNSLQGAVTLATMGTNADAQFTNSVATTLAGPANIGGDLTVAEANNNAITLNGVDVGGTLVLTTTGTVTLNPGTYTIGGPNPYVFGAVTLDGSKSGTITLGQNTTFGGVVTLANDTTLSSTNGHDITFSSTVGGDFALSANAGTGTITFGGAVGTLASLSATSTKATNGIVLDADVTTTGAQGYTGAVELANPGTITLTTTGGVTADTISFSSTVDGANAGAEGLVATSGSATGPNVTFAGAVGGTTALGSLSVTGGTISLSNVKTTGGQGYTDTTLDLNGSSYLTNAAPSAGTTAMFSETGATQLGATTVTIDTTGANTSAAGASISLGSVDATTMGGQSLTLTSGSDGTITLGAVGKTGAAGTTQPANLSAAGASIILDGNVSTTTAIVLDSTGTGTLTIPSTLASPLVELSSGGGVSETPTTGIVDGTAMMTTSLSVYAAGPVSMTDANIVNNLAFDVTSTNNAFDFRDASTALTITTVANATAPGGNVVGGKTNGGQIGLSTTSSGDITVSNNITSTPATTGAGAEIDISTAAGSSFTLSAATQISSAANGATGGVPAAGNIVILADAMTLTGTISTGSTASGVVVLAPQTSTEGITLGSAPGGTLSLLATDVASVTEAQMLQIGYRTNTGTQFDGNIAVSGPITVTAADVPTLELVTGMAGNAGTISESGTGAITAGTLGLIAGGNVRMGSLSNAVTTLAGFSDSGDFTFQNTQALTVGAASPTTQAVAFSTPSTGLVQSAALTAGGGLTNPLTGVVVNDKNIFLTTLNGGITLNQQVNAYDGSTTLGTPSSGEAEVAFQTQNTGDITQSVTGGNNGLIYAAALEVQTYDGSVVLNQANRIGADDNMSGVAQTAGVFAAADVLPASTGTVTLRDSNASLETGTLSVLADGDGLSAESGVKTHGGNIILETTTAGGLILDEQVNAGSGSIALGSAGTITQGTNGVITTTATGTNNGLEIVSVDQVSLGAAGGTSASNQIAQLAANVTTAGESLVVLSTQDMTVTSVNVADTAGNNVLLANGKPQTSAVSGVTTDDANLALRVTGGNNTLTLSSNVSAGTGGVGFESAGQLSETGTATIGGSSLTLVSGGPVQLLNGNTVGTLAAEVTGSGNSFAFNDTNNTLTVGSVAALQEASTFTAPPPASGNNNDAMLACCANGLAGVSTNDGNIVLQTTTLGNIVLDQPVNANTFVSTAPSTTLQTKVGSVGLFSAGGVSQLTSGNTGGVPNNGLVYGAQLEVVAADTVSLGAANRLGEGDNASGVAQTAGVLAGLVTTANNSFAFADDAASLTVGTVDVKAAGFADVSESGVVTADTAIITPPPPPPPPPASTGNIILETTNVHDATLGTQGNILLTQQVNANSATGSQVLGASPDTIGLSSVGSISQSSEGLIIGSQLDAVAAGSVTLTLANRLGANDQPMTTSGVAQTPGVVAGTAGMLPGGPATTGQSFAFADDAASLTVGQIGQFSAGTSGAGQLTLSTQTGVVTQGGTGGNIILETTDVRGLTLGGQGNLLLAQQVNANGGTAVLGTAPGQVGLSSVGTISQSNTGTTTNGAKDNGLIVGSAVETVAMDTISLGLPNIVGNAGGVNTAGLLAGRVLTSGDSFSFEDAASGGLAVDTVDVTTNVATGSQRLVLPAATAQNLTAALSGVATQGHSGGNIVVETTMGNLALNQRVDAGANFSATDPMLALTTVSLPATPGEIGLSSAGTISQTSTGMTDSVMHDGRIVGSELDVVAAGSVSLTLGNRLGAGDSGGVAATAGILAGTAGMLPGSMTSTPDSSFAFADDAASLTVGQIGQFSAGTSGAGGLTLGTQSGVVTAGNDASATASANGDIILETTNNGGKSLGGQGNLLLVQQVNANGGTAVLGTAPGQVGLSSVGTISQSNTGTTTNGAMDNGLIVGSAVEAVATDTISLGLPNIVGNAGGANTVGLLAGRVLTSGDGFSFEDAASGGIAVDTVDVETAGSTRLVIPASTTSSTLPAALSGVATELGAGGNIVIETTMGNLALNQRVDAGGNFSSTTLALNTTAILPATPGEVGLSSAGDIAQSNTGSTDGVAHDGRIVAAQLDAVAAETVSLGLANRLGANDNGSDVAQVAGVLSGTAGMLPGGTATTGQSFAFADDAASLTVGQIGQFSAGIVGAGQLTLSTQAGVVTQGGAGGNIVIETTNANSKTLGSQGNLLLTQQVNANGGTAVLGMTPGEVGLSSVGTVSQSGPGLIVGSQLDVLATDAVTLTLANRLGNTDSSGVAQNPGILAGAVTTSGQGFAFTDNNAGTTVGTVSLSAGVSGDGGLSLGPTSGVTTAGGSAGNITLTTTGTGNLVLNGAVTAPSQTATFNVAGTITQASNIVTAGTLAMSGAGGISLEDANRVTNLGASSNTGAGGFILVDAAPLTATGTVNAGSGDLDLTSSGSLTVNGALSAGGYGILNAASITLGANLTTGKTASLTTTSGNMSETGGATITAPSLLLSSAGTVLLSDGNQVATLAATSAGQFEFIDANPLTIGAVSGGTGSFLTGNKPFSGLTGLTTGGDAEVRLTSGDLVLANDVTADNGSANLALVAAGNLTQTGGRIAANDLIAKSGGSISLDDNSPSGANNLVGTLAASAPSGIAFGNATNLTLAAVAGVIDVAGQSGLVSSAGQILVNVAGSLTINGVPLSTSGDILVTTTGGMTTSGSVPLTSGSGNNNIILASGGTFDQVSGTITISGTSLVIDTTGTTAAALDGTRYTEPDQIPLVAAHDGSAKGDITFGGTLSASSSLLLLASDGGVISGKSVVVGALGVSNTVSGGSAALNGSIANNSTQTAAELGQAFTAANNNYRFNDCAIGSVSCTVLPALTPVVPAPITDFAVLVAKPTSDDVDAPLTNVFDEDRLCDEHRDACQ